MQKNELTRFTGCVTSKAQLYWLKRYGVKHATNLHGNPVVIASMKKPPHAKGPFLAITAIKAKNIFPRHGVGIYFLVDGDSVVYVGKTTNFFSRMSDHVMSAKEFERICFVPVDACNLDLFEREYIARFNPRYNIAHMVKDAGELLEGDSVS
jgi:hypothetical protein